MVHRDGRWPPCPGACRDRVRRSDAPAMRSDGPSRQSRHRRRPQGKGAPRLIRRNDSPMTQQPPIRLQGCPRAAACRHRRVARKLPRVGGSLARPRNRGGGAAHRGGSCGRRDPPLTLWTLKLQLQLRPRRRRRRRRRTRRSRHVDVFGRQSRWRVEAWTPRQGILAGSKYTAAAPGADPGRQATGTRVAGQMSVGGRGPRCEVRGWMVPAAPVTPLRRSRSRDRVLTRA